MNKEKLPPITIIAAMTKDRVIGIGDKLPWRSLKDDMLNFKSRTMRNTCIMGFNTWESFGKRPLPNRVNIVITSKDLTLSSELYDASKSHDMSQTYFANSIEGALTLCQDNLVAERQIFVIGGGTIYKQFLEKGIVSNMILTLVDSTIMLENEQDADLVFFPIFDVEAFHQTEKTVYDKSERNDHSFTIVELTKN